MKHSIIFHPNTLAVLPISAIIDMARIVRSSLTEVSKQEKTVRGELGVELRKAIGELTDAMVRLDREIAARV